MKSSLKLVLVFSCLALVAACGGPSTSSGGTGGGGGSSSTSSSSSSSGGHGGGAGCVPADCSDGFNCTIDTCSADVCHHTIGPNQGPTACPPGQYCELQNGCIAAPACATTADCVEHWKSDACKQDIQCDPVSSLCTFQVLDKDKDGHPPPVCDGDDCDDSDAARFPGNTETCDGKDNNCDGDIDETATCPDPLHACQSGMCQCAPDNLCDYLCVDKNSNPQHCGSCGKKCGVGFVCKAGSCSCELTDCGDICVNTKSSLQHCGKCMAPCPQEATCQSGKCICPSKEIACAGVCVDSSSDDLNCGGCGIQCPKYVPCEQGTCECVPEDCPGVDTDCATRVCVKGQCGTKNEPKDTDCIPSGDGGYGGYPKVCDGNGNCVECNDGSQCASQICKDNYCVE